MIAMLGSLFAGAVIVGLVMVTWTSEHRDQTAVELLRVILSWPVLGFVLALLVLSTFTVQIRAVIVSLVDRPFRSRAGAMELEAGPTQPGTSGGEQPHEPDTDAHNSELDALRKQRQLTQSQRDELLRYTQELRSQVMFWYWEYLTYYLRPHTQAILRWIAGNDSAKLPITTQIFDLVVLPDTPEERFAVMSALRGAGLIDMAGTVWVATDAARRFLAHVDARHPQMKFHPDPNPPFAPRSARPAT